MVASRFRVAMDFVVQANCFGRKETPNLTLGRQAKIPFSSELIRAQSSNKAFAKAFRRVAKRKEAVATATPYSVSVVGFGDGYVYTNGGLCYVLCDTLRFLDVHKSASSEVVIQIPELLREFLPTAQRAGRFRVLYYNDGIVSCLYRHPELEAESYLIVVNVWKRKLLFALALDTAEKIFVRNNSKFLYYGVFTGNAWERCKKWVLRGYHLDHRKWLEQRIHLHDLIGAEIGSTVCFEIHGGYFYALSNQTTPEVEEVDWTSFYHCMRFPVDSPYKNLVEKTDLDTHMWRRQHREGPIDDRWGCLSLSVDEATGELKIVEARKEFRAGASTSQRTYYTTKIVFPEKSIEDTHALSASDPWVSDHFALADLHSSVSSRPASTIIGRHELAALTNDPLALTITSSDNPHWLTPQRRLARNVHPGDDGLLVFFRTPLRYYNLSASAFLDLVDDRPPCSQDTQRLRLRVGSRKLGPPARDENGILMQYKRDRQTRDMTEDLCESYTELPVVFWPPEQDPCEPFDEALDMIYKLLNPPTHVGNVEGTADERSLVYLTGSKDMPRAILLVNFDPAITLRGLQKFRGNRGNDIGERTWYGEDVLGNMNDHVWGDERETLALEEQESPKNKEKKQEGWHSSSQSPTQEMRWIWTEPAMYMAINRGYDFSF